MTGLIARLRERWPQSGSLGQRFATASLWTVGGTAASYSMRLGSNLILARLLVPDMFGLMMFATTLYTAIELLTDVGIPLSIQREKDGDDPHFLRVAWTVNIVRSGLVALLILAAAALLGSVTPALFQPESVYAAPEAPLLVALIAAIPVLNGLSSTSWFLALRQMRVGRMTLVGFFAQLTSLICMTVFALIWPSVWALLAGMMVQNAFRLVASHTIISGPRMAWVWDAAIANRLWSFGKWIMVSTPFGFFAYNLDMFLLGAMIDATTFGLYSISRVWAGAMGGLVEQALRVVGLPGLSEVVRTRPGDFDRVLRKLLRVVDTNAALSCLVLSVGADLLIRSLYPDNYAGAVLFLRILALQLLREHFETVQTALLSFGKSKVILLLSLQKAVGVAVGMAVCHAFLGVEAVVYAFVLGPMVSVPTLLYFCRRVIPGYRIAPDLRWLGVMGLAVVVNMAVF